MRPSAWATALAFLAVSVPAFAQEAPSAPPPPPPPPPGVVVSLTTLRVLREKGILSRAEYDSAMRDIANSSGGAGGDDLTLMVSKFAATFYGFIESDAIFDSTQSLNDSGGNAQIARPGTYAGSNTRVQFGVRNSRFGIRLKAPSTQWFRASGVMEMDFLGATLPIGSGEPYYGTEAAYFSSPTFRVRHAYLKFETPVVDLLMGQYWHLYGWSASYLPNTVEIQGLPGEIYSRVAQIRLSHAFRSQAATFELAVAAMRPPQRNSGLPEGTAGFQLAFPGLTGMQTLNSTGTQIVPASIAVTGDARRVAVANYSAKPTASVAQTGLSLAVDALIPIIPATKDAKGNSMTLSGEFSYGNGISDLYTGMTGGVPIAPALPNPMMLTPAPTYPADIDQGIASFDGAGNLHLVQWTTFNAGLQYYFPKLDGRLWVSGNYARSMSSNAKNLLGTATGANAATIATAAGKVRDHEDWFDFNIFGDPYPGVRIGLEYARFLDTYVDGVQAKNDRVQLSGFFIF